MEWPHRFLLGARGKLRNLRPSLGGGFVRRRLADICSEPSQNRWGASRPDSVLFHRFRVLDF
jgi:hypothetical protein